MGPTRISSREIRNAEVTKDDINITDTNKALIQQVLAGVGISLDWTGVDEGTGVVTISATENLSFSYRIINALIEILNEQQMAVSGEMLVDTDGELSIEGELVIN